MGNAIVPTGGFDPNCLEVPGVSLDNDRAIFAGYGSLLDGDLLAGRSQVGTPIISKQEWDCVIANREGYKARACYVAGGVVLFRFEHPGEASSPESPPQTRNYCAVATRHNDVFSQRVLETVAMHVAYDVQPQSVLGALVVAQQALLAAEITVENYNGKDYDL